MRIVIRDYISIGSDNIHNGSSYQVATDPDFIHIIDQSIMDKNHVNEWHSMLPVGGDEHLPVKDRKYYSNLDKLYARVRVHIDNSFSPWKVLPVVNQQDQDLIITEDGKPDISVNTIINNIKTYEG